MAKLYYDIVLFRPQQQTMGGKNENFDIKGNIEELSPLKRTTSS